METLKCYTVKMLLSKVMNWAYDHDVNLYKNLDYAFGASEIRSGINQEQQNQMKQDKLLEHYTTHELLEQAIAIADYQDVIKFNQAFVINHHSTNKVHYTYGWKFDDFTLHAYSSLIEHIRNRTKVLQEKGLADWHKSEDHDKHHHFRYWMNEFLREDKHFTLRLFVVNSGNTRCFDTLHVGTNQSPIYQEIVRYVLGENIVPDPHHKQIDIPDFVNPDNYNERLVTRSGKHGGFCHLVYVTAEELQEIYEVKFKDQEESLYSAYEKPFWAFINAFPKNQNTKFYLFFT